MRVSEKEDYETLKHTPQEERIIDLILLGYSNREIAAELGIAVRTVKGYLHHIFMRNGITGGIKRVKLAVKVYRERQGGHGQ